MAVQRELTPTTSLELAYAGSHIVHVGIPDVNSNQLTVQQLALGRALLQKVPNPYYGQIPTSSSIGGQTITLAQSLMPYPQYTRVALFRNNTGSTVYDALEAKLQQRVSHGLTFLISYTRSKLIDTASAVFDSSVLTGPVANFPVADSHNETAERDLSSGDMPNVFVASYTWELPIGRGYHMNPSGILGLMSSGW